MFSLHLAHAHMDTPYSRQMRATHTHARRTFTSRSCWLQTFVLHTTQSACVCVYAYTLRDCLRRSSCMLISIYRPFIIILLLFELTIDSMHETMSCCRHIFSVVVLLIDYYYSFDAECRDQHTFDVCYSDWLTNRRSHIFQPKCKYRCNENKEIQYCYMKWVQVSKWATAMLSKWMFTDKCATKNVWILFLLKIYGVIIVYCWFHVLFSFIFSVIISSNCCWSAIQALENLVSCCDSPMTHTQKAISVLSE